MAEKFYCVMPTSTVYCSGQKYRGKTDEVQQIVRFLENQGVKEIELVVASSIGADLAMIFLKDAKIKPYFIAAGKNLTYGNLRRQLTDSLEDKPFPKLSEELQRHTFWEFGSKEEHFKYRNAVMQTYIHGNFPVFEGFNHMQYQIREPEGFARMLEMIIETGSLPNLEFVEGCK